MVRRIDPVPWVREAAFWCVGIAVGPGGGAADGGVVGRWENVSQSFEGFGC